ncbi:MAG: hypothetical protein JXR94_01770, partial [Candidatus Hydrogenedentes bacterium]|nr:hypothetical protein [Candidatus Hydrogenedentota bacterium]
GGGGGSNWGGGGGGSNWGGGSGSGTFSNISDLFYTISDETVGEYATVVGLSESSTGTRRPGQTGTQRPGQTGTQQQQGGADLGASAGLGGYTGESDFMTLLMNLVPPVIEPYTGEELSWMVYLPTTNMLIVHNTPSNLDEFESHIAQLDVTPKQVSIESKFITISVTDMDKIGFTWNVTQTDINSRTRQISSLAETTYSYDINGDGVDESIPFYTKPDGTQVINNTVVENIMSAVTNPGPAGSFSLATTITDNADGDRIGVTMDFLDSLSESELLSAPRVTTMNRKPAVIADFLTQTFNTSVYSELQTSDAGFGGTPTTSASQQLEFSTFIFGITLSVTPQISGGDQVRLWLNPQVTSKVGEDEFNQTTVVEGNEQTAVIRYPRTAVSAVWTNVIVHDGDTLVLGGLVSDRTNAAQEKVPYIADLPVLGFFFRGKSKEITQASLLIFVTVDIVDPMGARFFESGV